MTTTTNTKTKMARAPSAASRATQHMASRLPAGTVAAASNANGVLLPAEPGHSGTRPLTQEEAEHTALGLLLAEIRGERLLTHAEEVALAHTLRDPAAPEAERKAARETMVRANVRLVVFVATRYLRGRAGRYSALTLDDLVQEGMCGLLRAVEKFDPDAHAGGKFSTYAIWWIRQAITRALYTDSDLIRLPVHVAERRNKAQRVRAQLLADPAREDAAGAPTDEEIAAALTMMGENTTAEQVRDAERAGNVISLERPVTYGNLHANSGRFGSDVTRLGELIADPESTAEPLEDRVAERVDRASLVARMAAVLGEREALVLRLRFGLGDPDRPDGAREHTLTEVGARLGVSRERVRQIESKALRKLRETWDREWLRELLSASASSPAASASASA